jgi:hypothetical protein
MGCRDGGAHSRNSIRRAKNGIFTCGVLIDIPRLDGVPYLEPGTPTYVEDLEAWEDDDPVRPSVDAALSLLERVHHLQRSLNA